MIITSLKGGIGNQLFQYAAGRSLSLAHDVPLRLDLSWYENAEAREGMTSREFALDRFSIAATPATREEIQAFPATPVNSRVRSAITRIVGTTEPQRIDEKKYFAFDPAVLRAGRDTYLNGYWQNERYFRGCAATIRADLSLKATDNVRTKQYLDRISSEVSVGVHVRRGDYLTSGASAETHAVLSTDYYSEAMRQMRRNAPAAKFYVFSDDPDWARDNVFELDAEAVNFVTATDDLEEFRLMSACRHQIIANSTFSWWAAWLNDNKQKTVIAPRRWFNADVFDTSTLILDGWIAL